MINFILCYMSIIAICFLTKDIIYESLSLIKSEIISKSFVGEYFHWVHLLLNFFKVG